MLCVLIMAGGIGSRFWPQSTEKMPKQFLKLLGDKSMIQMTYDRMKKITNEENIFIVTNKNYVNLIKEHIPNISNQNIICEPCSKNTAPCILLSSLYIKNLYNEANIICVSSDSYIGKEDVFVEKIRIANDFLSHEKKAIVTLGIKPTRIETGYGYIKYEKSDSIPNKVIKFVEKPSYDVAKEYFLSGDYLWNAGMFIFNNLSMLDELKNNLTNEYNLLKDLPNINDVNYNDFLEENYQKCTKISIDYAVMEKSSHVYAISSDINWDDVGSWKALERYTKKDVDDNISKGDIKTINSHNNVIYGNNKKIVLVNVDDLYCIDSNDVIIIGKKDDIGNVHLLKDEI